MRILVTLSEILRLTLLAACCMGCRQPNEAAAPSLSPQDVYVKEAEVLERMYVECDRLELEKERHHKFAEHSLNQVENFDAKKEPENAAVWRVQMNKSKQDEVMAEAEMVSIRRVIPAQRKRVRDARRALGLSDH